MIKSLIKLEFTLQVYIYLRSWIPDTYVDKKKGTKVVHKNVSQGLTMLERS